MRKVISYEFNIDTGCVKAQFTEHMKHQNKGTGKPVPLLRSYQTTGISPPRIAAAFWV